jgi:hypothetical protein
MAPDYAAFDRFVPHPVYAKQRWISVLHPSHATVGETHPHAIDHRRPRSARGPTPAASRIAVSEDRIGLELTREQVLGFRRRAGDLDRRLPRGEGSLRQAAWAGLQDSMPRAALLSLHARVEGIVPSSWGDPALVQLWGPRYSAYVVPRRALAAFSLSRLPDGARQRQRAVDIADRLDAFLAGRKLDAVEAGRGLGIHPNALRYAAPTGRVLIRWDGARQPTVWAVPAPEVDPLDARVELARRCLHVFGPTTPDAFAGWAGITPPMAHAAFEVLRPSLAPVRTPIGDGWILESDEPAFRAPPDDGAAARLLPSGDTFYLLQGADRALLVPDADRRARLWTPRVWPGALLVDGEPAGTWRRAGPVVQVEPWRRISRAERDAVEAEAATLPLPGVEGRIVVRWAPGAGS